jgi:hypothetical protein
VILKQLRRKRACKPHCPADIKSKQLLLNQERRRVNNVSFGSVGRIRVTLPSQFLSQKIFQFGTFGFGGNKDGNVRVGVFPERQKVLVAVLVASPRPTVITLKCICSGEIQIGSHATDLISNKPTMVQDFSKLISGFDAFSQF